MLFLTYLFYSSLSFGAPCCGGSSQGPLLISNDDSAQFGVQTSYAKIIGDAPEQGVPVFRSSKDNESLTTYSFTAMKIIFDRWQVGTKLPLVRRDIDRPQSQTSSTGLGDTSLGVGYEFLPEWDYSVWKPKGFVFSNLTFPTGQSVYESSSNSSVDAVGKGFFSLSNGFHFVKNWGKYDASVSPQVTYSFGRTFKGPDNDDTTISSFWGTSVLLSGGRSWGPLRAGLRLAPTYNQAKRVRNSAGDRTTSPQTFWDVGLDLAYLVNESWTLAASYTDQTIWGPAQNTTLTRSVGISAQYHLPR